MSRYPFTGLGAATVAALPQCYAEVHAERIRAMAKHDGPYLRSIERAEFTDPAWLPILMEEVGEVANVLNEVRHDHTNPYPWEFEKAKLRRELIQVAAMAVAWVQSIDADVSGASS